MIRVVLGMLEQENEVIRIMVGKNNLILSG